MYSGPPLYEEPHSKTEFENKRKGQGPIRVFSDDVVKAANEAPTMLSRSSIEEPRH